MEAFKLRDKNEEQAPWYIINTYAFAFAIKTLFYFYSSDNIETIFIKFIFYLSLFNFMFYSINQIYSGNHRVYICEKILDANFYCYCALILSITIYFLYLNFVYQVIKLNFYLHFIIWITIFFLPFVIDFFVSKFLLRSQQERKRITYQKIIFLITTLLTFILIYSIQLFQLDEFFSIKIFLLFFYCLGIIINFFKSYQYKIGDLLIIVLPEILQISVLIPIFSLFTIKH